LVDELELPKRITRAADTLRILLEEIQRAEITDDVRVAIEELALVARNMRKVAQPDTD
jgi:hypothetical protein